MSTGKIGYKEILSNTFDSTVSLVFNHFQVLRQLFVVLFAVSFLSLKLPEFVTHYLGRLIDNSTLLLATNKLITILMGSIHQGIVLSMIPGIVALKHRDESPDRSRIYSSMKSNLLPAIGISLVLTPLTLLGYGAFILPGILMSILSFPVGYIFLVNGQSMLGSFKQCGQWFVTYWKSILSLIVAALGISTSGMALSGYLAMGTFSFIESGNSTLFTQFYLFASFSIAIIIGLLIGACLFIFIIAFLLLLTDIDQATSPDWTDSKISDSMNVNTGQLQHVYTAGAFLVVLTVLLHSLFPSAFPGSSNSPSDMDVDQRKTATSQEMGRVKELEDKIIRTFRTNSDTLPESYWEGEGYRRPNERTIPDKKRYLKWLDKADRLHTSVLDASEQTKKGDTLAELNRVSRKLLESYPQQVEPVNIRLDYYEVKILSLSSDRVDDMLKLYEQSLSFIDDLSEKDRKRTYIRVVVREHMFLIGSLVRKLGDIS